MRKPCLLFLPVLLVTALQAQKRIHVPTGCAFSNDVENENPYVFDADPQVQKIVGDICRVIGIAQGFQLQSAEVKNALACERDGVRFILYNTEFLRDIQMDARTKWAAYGVLAHEIGHHVNGHHFEEKKSERRKEMELEADRFAGSALRLLGATKDEAKAAVFSLLNEGETSTHPPKTARNLAVVNGWNDRNQMLLDMGIPGVNDPTTRSGTPPTVRDRDGDGIPDGQDACPDIPGETLLKGCPDSDGDGIPNDKDDCPYKKGDSRWRGCPDSDDDGIPDNKDKCPYVRGELLDGGCPPPDDDIDGIPNAADRCPQLAGIVRFQGCPDTDGDGVPDPDDKCPTEKGDPTYGGCPSAVILGSQEQRARDKKKGTFGGNFGKPGTTATDQHNTAKPVNQGIPGGTGDNPFGKTNGSDGSGGGPGTGLSIGSGLNGRAVRKRGAINDTSQKQGKVVIEVCVDSDGNVISAAYTERGSTTKDVELRDKALASARAYKFAASANAKQCGTITFNFQLK